MNPPSCTACGQALPKTRFPLHRLSLLDLELARALAQGYSTIEIARARNRSPKTVECQRSRIKFKMGIEDGVKWMDFLRAVSVYD